MGFSVPALVEVIWHFAFLVGLMISSYQSLPVVM
jgi:hypothetical protein